MFKAESMLELRLNDLKHTNVLLTPKRIEKIVSKAPFNIDVLIEPYGITTKCHCLSHLIFLNAKTLLDILLAQITQLRTIYNTIKTPHF